MCKAAAARNTPTSARRLPRQVLSLQPLVEPPCPVPPASYLARSPLGAALSPPQPPSLSLPHAASPRDVSTALPPHAAQRSLPAPVLLLPFQRFPQQHEGNPILCSSTSRGLTWYRPLQLLLRSLKTVGRIKETAGNGSRQRPAAAARPGGNRRTRGKGEQSGVAVRAAG